MNKIVKYIVSLIFIFVFIFMVLPTINTQTIYVDLEVEAYERYSAQELFPELIKPKSKLSINKIFAYRNISQNEKIDIYEETVFRIKNKTSFYKSNEHIITVRGIDTIPPKIVVDKVDDLVLLGGDNLKDYIDLRVFDYRFGEYNYELKAPDFDVWALEPGEFKTIIDAQDLSNNQTEIEVSYTVDTFFIKEDDSILVWPNKARHLAADFVPNLVDLPRELSENTQAQLQEEAALKYIEMHEALEKETGLSLLITSAYETYKQEEAYSEHQTGLALDIKAPELSVEEFKDSKQYRWIKANTHKYGFVIRYTKDKEDITKIEHKDYHLRYIGVELANYLANNDLCFDEYMMDLND